MEYTISLKKLFILIVYFLLVLNVNAKEPLNLNFKNLDLLELINITSKIIDKNILITDKIDGKINFISNSPIYKEDLLNILSYVLKTKGYTLKSNNNFLTVVKYKSKKVIEEKTVEVVTLKNADAKDINKIVNQIISNNKYDESVSKPTSILNEKSNSIILSGLETDIKYYQTLINKLDISKQQVYVTAKIIEVSELKLKEIGVKYGIFGGSSDNSYGLATFAANMGGSAIPIVTSSIGLSIPNLNKGLALGATINLLNQNGAADIVSEPSLLCINNQQSSIYIGETRSIKTGTTTTSGGNINDSYIREDIGLSLKVKPRISNNNKVELEILTTIENIGQTTTNNQPNTTKKDLKTTAIVSNGESIILGGYIKEKVEYTTDKVPFLGDIPILGNLFKSDNTINDKINLVIIITPYIVPQSKDLTYIRDQLAKLKLLEDKYKNNAIESLSKSKSKIKNK